jgi:uncharacterized protein YlxW (UPF0749 family)
MEQWTYLVGLVLGSLLILTVISLALRNRKIGVGESFLVAMGIFLVGLSLWARVKISVGPEGWQAEFERMQKKVDALQESNVTLNEQVETMAIAVETERAQVVELTRVLEEQSVVDPRRLEMIRREIMSVPLADPEALRSNRDRIMRRQ